MRVRELECEGKGVWVREWGYEGKGVGYEGEGVGYEGMV